MNPRLHRIIALLPALLLAILCVLLAPQKAAAQSGLMPKPESSEQVTPADFQNPEIAKADNPGTEGACYGYAENQDTNAARRAQVEIGERCLPQNDSFKSAAEAASYLAIYQRGFSAFGKRMNSEDGRKQVQDAVRRCLSNSECGKDDQNITLGALVQYNFGKDLKAQLLENQSRAERMKSLDFRWSRETKDLRGRPTRIVQGKDVKELQSYSLRSKTFRLDKDGVEFVDLENQIERDKFGREFNRTFQGFVTEYTRSTASYGPKSRWHYVPLRSSALGGDGAVYVADFDPKNLNQRQGRSKINTERLNADIRSQDENVRVQEIVEGFKKNFKDVVAKPFEYRSARLSAEEAAKQADSKTEPEPVRTDSMVAATEAMGFGMPLDEINPNDPNAAKTPADLAALVVVNINKQIHLKEKEMRGEQAGDDRFPSSVPTGEKKARVVNSVTLNVAQFDNFLDQIWPPSVDKPYPEYKKAEPEQPHRSQLVPPGK